MKIRILIFLTFALIVLLSCNLLNKLTQAQNITTLVTDDQPRQTQTDSLQKPTPMANPAQPTNQHPTDNKPFVNKAELSEENFSYLGAFRLPQGGDRPQTFAYGGGAMTYRPSVRNQSDDKRLPGSLFISGHDRMPYGELPNGGQITEINIPKPMRSKDVQRLPTAEFLQGFHDVAKGFFADLDEIPRMGMAYLEHPATGAKIHLAWGSHLQTDLPSHAWFEPDLANPKTQGSWFIGNQSSYSVNGYIFDLPLEWAAAYTSGKPLATGRFRDGGWSGKGPSLFAYQPWLDEKGTPASDGSRLEEVVLLHYENSEQSEPNVRSMNGYQHPDEWEGGAFITTKSGKSAVLFAGTKSLGTKVWYGYANPHGKDLPCVDVDMVGQFTVCYQADGTACPAMDLGGCTGHNDVRGWWSTKWQAQFILYNPQDLAKVALGLAEAWQPQPYLTIPMDDVLLMNPAKVELEMLGEGDQRRYRIGEVAYDRQNNYLYVLEPFADEAQPVVHVWQIVD